MAGDVTMLDRVIMYVCVAVFVVAWFVLGARTAGIRADAKLSEAERNTALWRAQLQAFKLFGLAVAVFFTGVLLGVLLP